MANYKTKAEQVQEGPTTFRCSRNKGNYFFKKDRFQFKGADTGQIQDNFSAKITVYSSEL